jgi:hypothetical protein
MAGTMERDQVGKREWLVDLISIADVKEKPLLAMIPKGPDIANTLAQWQADSYEAPNTAGVVDGKDVENYEDAARNRQLLKVYCQTVRRTAKVSRLSENVSRIAGASKGELARAVDKKLEEIGRDIEATLCSDNDTQADDGSVPYKTRGLGSWISASAQSTFPVPAAFRTQSAAIDTTAMASLTEDILRTVAKTVYEQRGKKQNLTLLCGTDLKNTISGFTAYRGGSTNTYAAIRTYNRSIEDNKLTNMVSIYEGDFNTIEMIPSLLLAQGTANAPTRRGYLLDVEQLELCWASKPSVEKLPDLGGGPRRLIEGTFMLKVLNPLCLGKFAATS